MLEKIKVGLLLGFLFLVFFFATTATLDWICWKTGYYEQAAKETMVFND